MFLSPEQGGISACRLFHLRRSGSILEIVKPPTYSAHTLARKNRTVDGVGPSNSPEKRGVSPLGNETCLNSYSGANKFRHMYHRGHLRFLFVYLKLIISDLFCKTLCHYKAKFLSKSQKRHPMSLLALK